LLRDVFEGASPRPTLILEPTSTVTISTPSNQAVVAHQVPEPAAGLIAALALAVNAVARRRRRVRAVPLPGHEPNRHTCCRRFGRPSGGRTPGRWCRPNPRIIAIHAV
ncbi:MAG TPA: PEP-CTERM sorting domain-containing protein, partial [Longimicrobiales bacterium]